MIKYPDMEGFPYTPPEYAQQINKPEQPNGQGTLEANDSGKIETRIDEERREQKRKLLKLIVLLELLKHLEFRELFTAVFSHFSKTK